MTPLAAGVEGAIYRLGDGTVAKVWGRRHEAELMRMQEFYADVARAELPFAGDGDPRRGSRARSEGRAIGVTA